VRGVITQAKVIPSRDQYSGSITKLTVEIHETLVGSATGTLTAYCGEDWFPLSRSQLSDSVATRAEQLFFLQERQGSRWNQNIAGFYLANEFNASPNPVPLGHGARLPSLVTDDLRLLKTGDQVLAEVRLISKLPKSADHYAWIQPPHDVAAPLSIKHDWLYVSLNERTFETAKRWLHDPNPMMAWCGVEVLVHQRSPGNAEALRQFAWKRIPSLGWQEMEWIRLLQRLNGWGVTDLPSMVTPSPILNTHSTTARKSLGGFVAPALLYLFWPWRRRFRFLMLFWWFSVSGLIVLGVRSYWLLDAGTWKGHDIALDSGNVYFEYQPARPFGSITLCDPKDLLDLDDFVSSSIPAGLIRPDEVYDYGRSSSFAQDFPAQGRLRRLFQISGSQFRVSIWFLLSILVLPELFLASRRWLRRRRERLIRGFPVQLRDAG
jgi:hypothetical protein